MKDVGKLSELGLQVGDVVEYTAIGESHFKAKTFTFAGWKGQTPYSEDQEFGGETSLRTDSKAIFRILTRATSEPKLWRDMTAEEKGALLLAAHEGKVVEAHCDKKGWVTIYPSWYSDLAYRIKPEPKVETVTLYGRPDVQWVFERSQMDTHKITFNLIDGKPDCASVKMEAL